MCFPPTILMCVFISCWGCDCAWWFWGYTARYLNCKEMPTLSRWVDCSNSLTTSIKFYIIESISFGWATIFLVPYHQLMSQRNCAHHLAYYSNTMEWTTKCFIDFTVYAAVGIRSRNIDKTKEKFIVSGHHADKENFKSRVRKTVWVFERIWMKNADFFLKYAIS